MASRLLILCAMAAAVMAGPLPVQGEPVSPSGRARPERARHGIQIDSIDRDADQNSAWLRIQALSDTPVKESWEVMRDIERWDQVMDLISGVEVLGREQAETMYRLSISPPWPLSDYFSIVRVRESEEERTITYRVDQGFLFGTFGTISVGEDPAGSWMRFENLGSPQRRFPDWMLKIGVHLVLPSVLKDLRERILEVVKERKGGRATPYP